MAAFMILLVANTGKHSLAILALIRLLPSMSAHVDHEISFLRERSGAVGQQTSKKLEPRMDGLQMEV
jgi:hypothetical protein